MKKLLSIAVSAATVSSALLGGVVGATGCANPPALPDGASVIGGVSTTIVSTTPVLDPGVHCVACAVCAVPVAPALPVSNIAPVVPVAPIVPVAAAPPEAPAGQGSAPEELPNTENSPFATIALASTALIAIALAGSRFAVSAYRRMGAKQQLRF
ncbi:MAG TPA: hypothetical protein VMT96_00805 [Candidatus Bathyarchaeia archaeon]|nr:hypothetical protein [Candidatus Bathyarchaeia archaeon]